MQTTNEPLYSEREAAKILGIHFLTLRAWRRAGKIGHFRFSDQTIKYRPRDIEEFKRSSEIKARAGQDKPRVGPNTKPKPSAVALPEL